MLLIVVVTCTLFYFIICIAGISRVMQLLVHILNLMIYRFEIAYLLNQVNVFMSNLTEVGPM